MNCPSPEGAFYVYPSAPVPSARNSGRQSDRQRRGLCRGAPEAEGVAVVQARLSGLAEFGDFMRRRLPFRRRLRENPPFLRKPCLNAFCANRSKMSPRETFWCD
jgi:hypothetical protein